MDQKHYPKGLDDRMRDKNGQIHKKRADTKVETLREQYGAEFAKGYDPGTPLGTVLTDAGVASLDQFLKKH